MSQKIKENFNRGKKACGIFFDIAAAFDKVWHKGLLFKLIKQKFPNYIICWLKNFLENRSFIVKVGLSIRSGSQSNPIFNLYQRYSFET
jgi:hypothetical protein